MRDEALPRLVAIVGPTASGKSELAVALARQLRGEIVNCDSMQLIRGMDIGTAKPTLSERREIPHHLYDRIAPDELYSAGQYMEEARAVCASISERGHTPLVVGGTGLYLRSLLQGVFEGPGRSEKWRRRLSLLGRREGTAHLYGLLREADPEAARRIQPTDGVRIIRALEVFYETGRPISALQREKKPLSGFESIKIGIGLSRQILCDRIEARVRKMFQIGLLEEVQALLDQGFSPDCKGFEAIGYRQAISCLRGHLSLREAIESTIVATRQYAKRQMTWFRKDSEMCWIGAAGETPEALQAARQLLAFERRPGVWRI